MNEQRQEAYLNLINTLLGCSSSEEINCVLNANQNLVDSGLVQMMGQVAEVLTERGDRNAANFLINIARQLADALELSSDVIESKATHGNSLPTVVPEEYVQFLSQVLLVTAESDGNPQVVYPLLQANRDKLDDKFAQLLRNSAITILSEVKRDLAQSKAIVIAQLSSLIQNFPWGGKASNLEIAITGYEMVSSTCHVSRELWASVQYNLGNAYLDRISGQWAENLELAIRCYTQALEIYTRNDFPQYWARTQTNLGNAYSQRIRGKRSENLELAIGCYTQALQEFTYEKSPQDWAKTQNNLGNALKNSLREGERAENLELAIRCYTQALKVYTRNDFPQDWARTQTNLGNAYSQRIRGKRSENLELAIGCYTQALQEFTYEKSPQDWAKTQCNLGNALSNRLREGERAENLELAIRCYTQALEVYTRNTFPRDWAETQNDLGVAYFERIRGERAENLELAIHHYTQALAVYTRNDSPQDWAKTQNNLGNAYSNRIRGERAENLELAIRCYIQALEVYTRNDFLQDWAMTQCNLGNAYSIRIRGEQAENLELAIRCYVQALEVYTRNDFLQNWAGTQSNLGNAYSIRIYGERAENLELAIGCYKEVLEELTYDDFFQEWAKTQNNLGGAYSIRISGKRVENLERAIACYHAALKVNTRSQFPQGYVETSFNLGLAYIATKQVQEAYHTFKDTINTVEFLRDEIVSGDEIKQKFAEEWNKSYQHMVEVCLTLSKPIEAIEYTERSKNRNLVELILTRDRHTIFPTEVVAQLDRLRDEIASGQYELQNATAEDPTALAQHLQQLRQQRNELQDQYLPIGSGFRFEPFQSTLSDRTAIVEFYITADKLLVFIITKHTQQPIVLSPDLIDLNKLANWANSYLKAYSNKKSHWQRRLTTRLHLLAKILHIDEIIQQIPTECDKLILSPHRYLHLLPLHALPLAGDSSLFDKFPGGVSYAPSYQLLQLAQTRQRLEFTHLFAVQNPTGDLSYTDLEVETIQSYFNTSNLLKQKIATKEAIDNNSLTVVHCAHFSCHGYFNGTEPRKSALILANAKLNSAPTQPDPENYLSLENGGVLDLNKCLTLDSVFTLNLEQCRLVTLSACETGLIDFRNTSDEYIGLPSGFLYAGASSVVSSLWTVNDLSTAFLMIRFYQNLQNGLAVGLALNQAQLWLKNLSKGDLEIWIEENQLPLKPAVRMSFRRRFNKLEDDAKPFKSPFYWAGFCAIGQ